MRLKNTVRHFLPRAIKFVTFRLLFEGVYRFHARYPAEEKKVLFVEVREKEVSNSFRLLYEAVEQDGGYNIHTHFLRSGFAGRGEYVRRCIAMLRDAATAGYIFLNEGCNVLGSIRMRPETVLTQTWHACGAFKKFGFSTASLKFGGTAEDMRRYPYYGNTDYVTISSPDIAWAYEEAMMLGDHPGCLRPVGVSRTDVFFREEFQKAAREHFARCLPDAQGKKVILYAPTFRGNVADAVSPDCLDVRELKAALGDSYVLVCKHHPFVQHPPAIPADCAGFARDVTGELSIDELLCVSDICITDYSSLVFEYSLFDRPMIFFSYDLEDYFDWRGFYYDYHELAPGPVFRTTGEIIDHILHLDGRFDRGRVRRFREKFMASCDGHATERIMELVFGKNDEKNDGKSGAGTYADR